MNLKAKEYHVLAKITGCDTRFPYKVICNENSLPVCSWKKPGRQDGFKHVKPLPETVELTVEEISKLLGKNVKIIK